MLESYYMVTSRMVIDVTTQMHIKSNRLGKPHEINGKMMIK